MSKDHIKSELADTTDWENEGQHASSVYYRGCLIGYILELDFSQQRTRYRNRANQPFAHDMQYGEEKIDSRRDFTVTQHALGATQHEWLKEITILNQGNIIGNFRDFYIFSLNYVIAMGVPPFGGRTRVQDIDTIIATLAIYKERSRCVVLNRSGKMIFNSNDEIESTALATSCEFIENSFGYCLDLIRTDPDMRNRFRTAVYGDCDDDGQFEVDFRFNFSEQNYVYGTHFLTAINTCFANMAKIVPTLGNISGCHFRLHFEHLKDDIEDGWAEDSKFSIDDDGNTINIRRNVIRGKDVLDLSPVQGIGMLKNIPDTPLLLQTIRLGLSRNKSSSDSMSWVFERSWDD